MQSATKWVIVVTAMLSGLAGCGGSAPAADRPACHRAVQEPLDPRSAQHVLTNGGVTYASNPPTSGPHRPGVVPKGIVTKPLPLAVQVGALEAGDVLVQYKGAFPAELRNPGDKVVVAPNETLSSRVVITAWRWKMTCNAPDRAALRVFVTHHAAKGPK